MKRLVTALGLVAIVTGTGAICQNLPPPWAIIIATSATALLMTAVHHLPILSDED